MHEGLNEWLGKRSNVRSHERLSEQLDVILGERLAVMFGEKFDVRLGEMFGGQMGERLSERRLRLGERLGNKYHDWKYASRINQEWLSIVI